MNVERSLHPKENKMPKSAMVILSEHGLLQAGMKLEPVPEIMRDEYKSRLDEFRVTILKPAGGPNSIQWRGEMLSLNKMINRLEAEYGAHGIPGVCNNFRLAESLTGIARALVGPKEEIADEIE
jgi:hypothetical protein